MLEFQLKAFLQRKLYTQNSYVVSKDNRWVKELTQKTLGFAYVMDVFYILIVVIVI